MLQAILIPILVLVVLGILVTRLVEAVMPETLGGIVATGLVSALLLWGLSAAGFAALYAFDTPEVLDMLKPGTGGLAHFARLGAQAALVWGPILLLVISTAPRRWKTNVW